MALCPLLPSQILRKTESIEKNLKCGTRNMNNNLIGRSFRSLAPPPPLSGNSARGWGIWTVNQNCQVFQAEYTFFECWWETSLNSFSCNCFNILALIRNITDTKISLVRFGNQPYPVAKLNCGILIIYIWSLIKHGQLAHLSITATYSSPIFPRYTA